MYIRYNLINKRFGRLLVLENTGSNHRGNKIWKCQCDCGKIVHTLTLYLICGDTKSCGCLKIDTVKARCGPKNCNWKPELTEEERKRRKLYRIGGDVKRTHWSKQIKAKDGFKCRKCFINNDILQSHHILGWLDYPELRFDLNNGICLCRKCHRKFHTKYGMRNFTKADLEEFLGSDE